MRRRLVFCIGVVCFCLVVLLILGLIIFKGIRVFFGDLWVSLRVYVIISVCVKVWV